MLLPHKTSAYKRTAIHMWLSCLQHLHHYCATEPQEPDEGQVKGTVCFLLRAWIKTENLSLENFLIGAGSSPLVVLHIRTNDIEGMLLKPIEGDYTVLGKAVKEVDGHMCSGIALVPTK